MKAYGKKSVWLALGCILMINFCGCSGDLDVGSYVKALLDCSYLNDSTDYLNLEMGTEEDAAACHKNYVDLQVRMTEHLDCCSDEVKDAYRELVREIAAKVKYEVGTTEKIDENTYEVTITYETMQFFANAEERAEQVLIEKLKEEQIALLEAQTQEAVDEVLYAFGGEAMVECMKDELAKVSYAAPETMVMRVERVEDVWTPNAEDVAALDEALYDNGNFEELTFYDGMLGEFDAGGYMLAIMDAFFKGETEDFVAYGLGTAEEALAIYNANLDNHVEKFKQLKNPDEESIARFRENCEEICGKMSYRVRYVVPMKEDTYDVYLSIDRVWVMYDITETYRNYADINERMGLALEDVSYSDEQVHCIRLNLSEDGIWAPREKAFVELEHMMVDYHNAIVLK